MIHKDKKTGLFFYRFQFNYKDYKKKGFRTKAEALEAENKKRRDLEGFGVVLYNLSDIYKKFVTRRSMRLKATTLEKDARQIEKYILPSFPSVSSVSVPAIVSWKADLINKGFAESYINQVIKCFRQLMRFASSYAPLHPGVLEELESVRLHQVKPDMVIWSVDEFKQFISTFASTDPFRILFECLFFSGMRISELRALKPADLVGDEIVINKRLESKSKDHKGITTLKTSASNRRVLMPHAFMERLRSVAVSPGLYLFPISESSIRRALDSHVALSGVKKIRIHDLRHSACSFWINSGMSIRLCSERLGHSSPSITMDYYWHLLPNEQRQVVSLIESSF